MASLTLTSVAFALRAALLRYAVSCGPGSPLAEGYKDGLFAAGSGELRPSHGGGLLTVRSGWQRAWMGLPTFRIAERGKYFSGVSPL